MRNKQKGLLETALPSHLRKVANGHGVAPKPMAPKPLPPEPMDREPLEPGCRRRTRGVKKSAEPTIWDDTLGEQISQARAACLRGLSQIPSGMGKLAYLAILQHRLLGDHEELFEEWLGCSLQQQYELLCRSLAAEGAGTPTDTWLNPSAYSELIPASAQKSARTAYLANLGALLETLKNELSGSSGRPREEALAKG